MLQTEFSHDTFGMLSFLRLIGLRIDGRMSKLFSTIPDILYIEQKAEPESCPLEDFPD